MGKVLATAAERKKNQRENEKRWSYKIYLNKQRDLKATKEKGNAKKDE